MKAAEKSGTTGEVRARLAKMVRDAGPGGGFVAQVLGRELGS